MDAPDVTCALFPAGIRESRASKGNRRGEVGADGVELFNDRKGEYSQPMAMRGLWGSQTWCSLVCKAHETCSSKLNIIHYDNWSYVHQLNYCLGLHIVAIPRKEWKKRKQNWLNTFRKTSPLYLCCSSICLDMLQPPKPTSNSIRASYNEEMEIANTTYQHLSTRLTG